MITICYSVQVTSRTYTYSQAFQTGWLLFHCVVIYALSEAQCSAVWICLKCWEDEMPSPEWNAMFQEQQLRKWVGPTESSVPDSYCDGTLKPVITASSASLLNRVILRCLWLPFPFQSHCQSHGFINLLNRVCNFLKRTCIQAYCSPLLDNASS
jgi:hypothetical protein